MEQICGGMIESADEFVRLRSSEDPAEYRRAASEPATDAIWFEVLDRFPHMASWVAHNKTVSDVVITRLATHDDPRVKHTLAMKRRCPPAVLERLASDPDAGVRASVARNKKAPLEIIHRLAADPEPHVAGAAAAALAARGHRVS